jgi:hypothetical protein
MSQERGNVGIVSLLVSKRTALAKMVFSGSTASTESWSPKVELRWDGVGDKAEDIEEEDHRP